MRFVLRLILRVLRDSGKGTIFLPNFALQKLFQMVLMVIEWTALQNVALTESKKSR